MSELLKTLKGHFEQNIDDQAGIDLKSWMEQCDHTIAEATENIVSVVGEEQFPEVDFRVSIGQAMFPYIMESARQMMEYISGKISEDEMATLITELGQCAGYEPFDELITSFGVEEEKGLIVDVADGNSSSGLEELKKKYPGLVSASTPKEKDVEADPLPSPPPFSSPKHTAKLIKRVTRSTDV